MKPANPAAATATSEARRRVRYDDAAVPRKGIYETGREYEVPAFEAERLVRDKGFRYVDSVATHNEEQ